MQQRLQKILARAGLASRRAAEQLIQAGRVRVNGKIVTELGSRADPASDRVEVDGKRIVAEAPVYILLHKPRAVVSTLHDPEGRPTVASLVDALPVRVFPIGRLDYQTSGALLLTNDGDLSAKLLHPRHHVPKTYLVKVKGEMRREDLTRWREGVQLDDGPTLPAEAFVTKREGGHTWFELILREGRNQQIRRMGEATGFPVHRLTRTAFANLTIDGLRAGQWRFLTLAELRDLKSTYGVPKHIRAAIASANELASLQPARGRAAPRIKPEPSEDVERSGVRRVANKPGHSRSPSRGPHAPQRPKRKPQRDS